MKDSLHPLLMKDMYKAFHIFATKPGVEFNYSNFTPRFGKHSNTPELSGVICWGVQYFITEILVEQFNSLFFEMPKEMAVDEYKEVISSALNQEISVKHIEALHDLQYLPIQMKALPEGTFVPYGVPMITVKNTHKDFAWLVGALEDVISSYLWPMSTAATTAYAYRLRFEKSSADKGMIPFLGHDFSLRGMVGMEAGAMVGSGHLTSFTGSDNIPGAVLIRNYYSGDITYGYSIFSSVNATEHMVMCSYGSQEEKESIKHIITEVAPAGIVSLVCDAWDFWKVVTEYLVDLKDVILERDGTVVIRPDSGDPVDIICGTGGVPLDNGKYRVFTNGTYKDVEEHEAKGLVECLWDIFPGSIDENGLKVLNPHIGAIYGDSITLERQNEIINKLEAKGFKMGVVLGIGSYTYQYVTRDTHGFAMKSTAMKFSGDTSWTPIFKQPKTDSAKNSAKGLMMVKSFNDGLMYEVVQEATPEQEQRGALKIVFHDGKMHNTTNIYTVRENINKLVANNIGG